jgi:hypothetical protein
MQCDLAKKSRVNCAAIYLKKESGKEWRTITVQPGYPRTPSTEEEKSKPHKLMKNTTKRKNTAI